MMYMRALFRRNLPEGEEGCVDFWRGRLGIKSELVIGQSLINHFQRKQFHTTENTTTYKRANVLVFQF